MAISRTPIVDDDGTGRTGTVIDNAWKQQFYDQIDAALLGGAVGDPNWTNVAHLAGNFSATGGGWAVTAGNQVYYRYRRIGRTCFISLYLSGTTLSGTPTELNINLPTPAQAVLEHFMHASYYITPGMTAGQTRLAPIYMSGGTPAYMRIRTDYFGSAWAAGTLYLVINDSYPIA
jgi:hypothetical protein